MHYLTTGALAAWILTWFHIYSNASNVIIEGQNRILDGWHYNGARDTNRSQRNINTTHLLGNNSGSNKDIPIQGFLNHAISVSKLLAEDKPREMAKFRLDFTKRAPRNTSSRYHRTIIRFPKIKRRKFGQLQNSTSLNPISKALLKIRRIKSNAGSKQPTFLILPSDVIKLNNKTRNFWKLQNATSNFPKYVRIKKSDSASILYECNIMACPGNSTPSDNCLPLCAPKRIAPTEPPPGKLHVPLKTMPPTASTVPQYPPMLTLPPAQPLMPQVPYKDSYSRVHHSPPPVIISHFIRPTPFAPLPIKTPKPFRLVELSTPTPERPQTKMPKVVTKLVPPSPSKRVTIPSRFLQKVTPVRPKTDISVPPSQIKRRRPYPPDPMLPTETPKRVSPKLPGIDHQFPNKCPPEMTTPMPYIPVRYTPLLSTIPTEKSHHFSPFPDISLIPQLPERPPFQMPENIFVPPESREMRIFPLISPIKPYRLNMWNKLIKPQIPLRSHQSLITNPPPQIHWYPTSETPAYPVEIHYEKLPPALRPHPHIPKQEIIPQHDPIEEETEIRKLPPPALCDKSFPCRKIPPVSDPERRMPIKSPFPSVQYYQLQIPNHSYKTQWILPQIIQRPLLNIPPLARHQIPPPATYPYIPTPKPGFPFRLYPPLLKYPPQMYLLTDVSPTPHLSHEVPTRTPLPSEPPCADKVPYRICPKVKVPYKLLPQHKFTPPPAPFPQTPAVPELPVDRVEHPQFPDRPEATTDTVPVNVIFRPSSPPSHPPPQIKILSPLPIPCSLKGGVKKCVSHDHTDDKDHVYARHISDTGSPVQENITSPWTKAKQNSENFTGQFIPLHNVSEELSNTINLTDNVIEINGKRLPNKLHKYIDVDKNTKYGHGNIDSTFQMSMPKKASHHQFRKDVTDHIQSTSQNSEPLVDKAMTPTFIYFKS